MRVGPFLVLGLGLVLLGACNGPSPDVEACITQSGVCVNASDTVNCQTMISGSGLCQNGYVCCQPKGVGDSGLPADGGAQDAKVRDGSASRDGATKDGASSRDGASKDGASRDSASRDSGGGEDTGARDAGRNDSGSAGDASRDSQTRG